MTVLFSIPKKVKRERQKNELNLSGYFIEERKSNMVFMKR